MGSIILIVQLSIGVIVKPMQNELVCNRALMEVPIMVARDYPNASLERAWCEKTKGYEL